MPKPPKRVRRNGTFVQKLKPRLCQKDKPLLKDVLAQKRRHYKHFPLRRLPPEPRLRRVPMPPFRHKRLVRRPPQLLPNSKPPPVNRQKHFKIFGIVGFMGRSTRSIGRRETRWSESRRSSIGRNDRYHTFRLPPTVSRNVIARQSSLPALCSRLGIG